MIRLVCCLSAISLALAQGTNYQTGDGQVRSESVDQEGNIRGQYSYIDPNGKTVTVKYTAGKNGFQVEGGSGAPSAAGAPPTGPQFSQFAQGAPPQFTQAGVPQFLPPGAQFARSQQGLFAPSGPSFEQAASRGQVAQFSEEQARQAQQFGVPPQFRQAPTGPEFSPEARFGPSQANFAGAPQFTPQQLAQFNQQLSPQQLAQFQQQQQQLTPQQLAQFQQPQQLTPQQLAQFQQQQPQQLTPQQLAQFQQQQQQQQQQFSEPQISKEDLAHLANQQQQQQQQIAQQNQIIEQQKVVQQQQIAQQQQLARQQQLDQQQPRRDQSGQPQINENLSGQPQFSPEQIAQFQRQFAQQGYSAHRFAGSPGNQ